MVDGVWRSPVLLWPARVSGTPLGCALLLHAIRGSAPRLGGGTSTPRLPAGNPPGCADDRGPKGEPGAGSECRLRFAASASLSFSLGHSGARCGGGRGASSFLGNCRLSFAAPWKAVRRHVPATTEKSCICTIFPYGTDFRDFRRDGDFALCRYGWLQQSRGRLTVRLGYSDMMASITVSRARRAGEAFASRPEIAGRSWPIQPAAGNAGWASGLQLEHHRPGVPEPVRWAIPESAHGDGDFRLSRVGEFRAESGH